ncbi:hypothetical protein BH11PAT2_BH11PAT2_04870 [soil metagenome]
MASVNDITQIFQKKNGTPLSCKELEALPEEIKMKHKKVFSEAMILAGMIEDSAYHRMDED